MIKRFLHLCLMFIAVFTVVILLQPTEARAEEKYCYICEDMVEFCNYCGDYCMVCYTGCDTCMSCEDCLKLCEECDDVCVVCNIGCDTCWICEECIKVCQNCDACLECNGDGCANSCEQICIDCCSENDARCIICQQCVLCSSIKCEECGFCIECAPECQACGECMECHGGDGCANECGQLCGDCVSDNEGACPECGQCFLCVNWACDSCYKCEECLTEEFACSICEECIECNASGSCGSCNACWNCVPICTSCENACAECSELCSECEEYCGDCAVICEGCGVCENCAVLCEDCGMCENCIELCGDCGICADCTTMCQSCMELCVDCADDWCSECDTCSDCVDICEGCYSICMECADGWCAECYSCSDCEDICVDCGELCRGCAFAWCDVCNACEACVQVCEECNACCKDCADDWCINCGACSECTEFCPDCNDCVRCCMCDGEGGNDEEEDHQHDVTRVDGFDPTCTEPGQHPYYVCDCGKWFENAAATREITSKKSIVILAGHTYSKLIETVEPIHTAETLAPGMMAHYVCTQCGNYFTTNKKQTDKDSLTIPAPTHKYINTWSYKAADGHGKTCACGAIEAVLPHTPGPEATDTNPQLCKDCGYMITPPKNHIHKLSRVPGKEPTCDTPGQKEHFSCQCGKLFADEKGEKEITILSALELPASHTLSAAIPELPATHKEDGTVQPGMKAHYECEHCQKVFNVNKQEKPAESLAIAKAEHRFYDENGDGGCDTCETLLLKYNEELEQAKQPENTESTDEQIEKDGGSSGMPWWILVLLALVATAAGVLGGLLVMKKRNGKSC